MPDTVSLTNCGLLILSVDFNPSMSYSQFSSAVDAASRNLWPRERSLIGSDVTNQHNARIIFFSVHRLSVCYTQPFESY
jgi:hypothetical protein